MPNYKKHLDTSEELYIQQYHQGIKLITPDENELIISRDTNLSVKNAKKLPFCVYFLDKNSTKQQLNEYSSRVCGFSSPNHAVGKKVSEVLTRSSAMSFFQNDYEVVTFNRMKIVEEIAIHKNNTSIEVLSIKMPWYNSKNEIIGVFGCSELFDLHSIPNFLIQMLQLNFLKNNKFLPWSSLKHRYLTKRETEVLHYTIRGFSAHEVGQRIFLSQRTVEFYLEKLKQKFGVSSKSELVDTVVEHLIGNI